MPQRGRRRRVRVQPACYDTMQEMRCLLPRRLHRISGAMSHLPHTLTLPLWSHYGPLRAPIAMLLETLQGTSI